MKRALLLAGLTLVLPSVVEAGELDWLAGHWCGLRGQTFNEETWLPERGGVLIGLHRDTREGRAAGFEFLRIAQVDGRWTYLAQPNGGAVVPFTATNVTADSAEFANPAHDFPRRVIYRRVDADTLHARVDDGSDAGRTLEWTWTRECEAGAPVDDPSEPAQ